MGRWSPDVGRDGAATHSLFEVYDADLVPLVFDVYARDTVARLRDVPAESVLEIAAGTGVVTRHLARVLPPTTAITATDLVPGMLERARAVGTDRPVTWEVADALDLPYDDAAFDLVVCGFGAMFFDPHDRAFAEARRVLHPGGRLVLTVWDRLEANELAWAVHGALSRVFPDDPPGFLGRTPYGYADPERIAADLVAGGFADPPAIERVGHVARAPGAVAVARALCAGTPLRDEIQRRGDDALHRAIAGVATCLTERFGPGPVAGATSAFLVTATG